MQNGMSHNMYGQSKLRIRKLSNYSWADPLSYSISLILPFFHI